MDSSSNKMEYFDEMTSGMKTPPPEYASKRPSITGTDSSAASQVDAMEAAAIACQAETVDHWDIVDQEDTQTKWSELSLGGKVLRVIWIIVRLVLIIGILYFFVCSLDVLQDSFQLLSGRAAGNIFASSFINNAICGLMVGVLVTVLVQSSSTSTSIVVSMVGSNILTVQQAIPIIMGANIGTTVTNTLVALTQSTDRNIFRRAFAGATVHDMFNWLTVLILLPLEVATHYLFYLTEALTQDIKPSNSDNPQFLKVITVPLTSLIVEVDKKVITAIAEDSDRQKFPLVKYYCKEVTKKYAYTYNTTDVNQTAFDTVNSAIFSYNVQLTNVTGADNYTTFTQLSWTEVVDANSTKCEHVFVGCGLPGYLSEAGVGAILLVGSLLALILCLVILVKILSSLLSGPMARIVRTSINADFPGYAAFLTGYFVMLIGAGVTVLVQSSSVFTSALTPLVGLGVVTVERVYPMTLGSNIGTTVTSILAALTADANKIKDTMQISLCHLFFNITGILIWYPIPFMRRLPIALAKGLGNVTANYRWFAIVYLILLYLLMPLVVFGLSVAGFWVLMGVLIPVAVLVITVVIINVLQSKRPQWLPAVLRNWHFLPLPMRSLKPYDDIITMCFKSAFYQKYCRCCIKSSTAVEPEEVKEVTFSRNVSEANLPKVATEDEIIKEKPVDFEVDEVTTFGGEGQTNDAYVNDGSERFPPTTVTSEQKL